MNTYLFLSGACLALAACKPQQDIPTPLATKPTARFTAPDSVVVAVPSTYAPTSAVVPFNNISTNYRTSLWTWGDGTSLITDSLTITPTHTYAKLGKYRVQLKISNNLGADTSSKVVRIVFYRLPAPVMHSIAGKYYGTLQESFYNLYPQLLPHPTRPLVRDTLIQVSLANSQSISVGKLGLVVPYNSSAADWRGHQPNRANYLFAQPYYSDTRTEFQVTQAGDSIYFYTNFGGLGAGKRYLFYGKKQ